MATRMLFKETRPSRLRPLLVIVGLLALVLVAAMVFRVGAPPEVAIETDRPGIGGGGLVALVRPSQPGRGLAEVTVELHSTNQIGNQIIVLTKRLHRPRPFYAFWGPRVTEDTLEATITPEVARTLTPGTATLRVIAARPGTPLRRGQPVVETLELPVDFTPPSLAVLSTQIYAAQGGSEAVVYRVDETAARHGVRSGDAWFEGFTLPGGGSGEHFVIFGVPFDLEDEARVRLVAADALGNELAIPFLDRFTPKPYRRSIIDLDDAFLQRVVPAIVAQTPEVASGQSLLETYLFINSELRACNARSLRELGARTEHQAFWRGAFVQQPNSKVMDSFAAARTYVYQDREVDRQVHLGYDLASVQHDRVLAANRGRVSMAGYFGIYGNTVVVDHGYGVSTLYAHLSSIDVALEQMVEQGAVLGRSGETGLAGGDHLHFTVLVQGEPVAPAEWFDASWIRNRIAAKLADHVDLGL